MSDARDIAVDAEGHAYVTGYEYCSESSVFPVQGSFGPKCNGDYDAYLVKVAVTGQTISAQSSFQVKVPPPPMRDSRNKVP